MRIVIGRGNHRKVYELPHGSAFKRAEKDEPTEVRAAVDNVCRIVGVLR